VLVTILLAATSALASAALASAKSYTVGSPQPELALFNVGASGSDGSGAVLPDGTLVLVSQSSSGATARVCMLHPGERKCASTATLSAYNDGLGDQDLFFDNVEVVPTGGKDVSVVLADCCYLSDAGSNGGAVVFNSTNDGATFGPEEPAGSISAVDSAAFADGQIVVGASGDHGTQVQAFSPSVDATSAQPVMSGQVNSNAYGASVSDYNGGVLVASYALGSSSSTTTVEYAPSGANFNDPSAYSVVATLAGQQVLGLSGNALLTNNGSLTHGAQLRLFNGSSFGAPATVPEPSTGDDGYWSIQETGSVVHVFYLNRRNNYDIYEATRTGAHWAPLAIYNTAVTSGSLVPVLGPTGSGLVYETSSSPLLAQPILNPQTVVIKRTGGKAYAGQSTTVSGHATPRLAHQAVTLERLSAGRWYNVATTHESTAGKFSFRAPVGRTYRAVVAYDPGYYLYGYSNSMTLVAAVRHKAKK
jgi:hypothetical protein